MGKKGTPHRKWSKEEKLRFIRLHLDEHISITEIERKYGVGHSLVSAWVKRYLEDGEEALEPKNGNPYAALHTSKSLSEVDRLRLIIAKQEVEIARLKKGYWVEGEERLRSHRGTEDKVPGRFSVSAHGRKPLRLLQVAAEKRNAQPP